MRTLLKHLFMPVLHLLEEVTDFHTSPLPQVAERLKMMLGWYEIGTTRFIRKRLRGGTAFDIGANVGYYARLMSRYAAHVYAFEPDPDNFKILQRNCAKHKNITPLNMAVSDRVGTAEFFKVPDSAMRHSLIDEGKTVKISVACTSIDAFVAQQGISGVSMMKIDVEGAEPLVFAGMADLLAREKPVIIYEGDDPEAQAISESGELVRIKDAPRLGAQQRVTNLVRW